MILILPMVFPPVVYALRFRFLRGISFFREEQGILWVLYHLYERLGVATKCEIPAAQCGNC